ncbi:hypothetical protein A3Q56_06889 [Intoshia linei]|uniref:C2H2-type domain-containing protein n=1 Tax=Intoshia linei TaxID=1819745 RepID=A0A177ATS1_9BILA|nr:hypothetical protein A3Q56_06889 [Intoshia linei]
MLLNEIQKLEDGIVKLIKDYTKRKDVNILGVLSVSIDERHETVLKMNTTCQKMENLVKNNQMRMVSAQTLNPKNKRKCSLPIKINENLNLTFGELNLISQTAATVPKPKRRNLTEQELDHEEMSLYLGEGRFVTSNFKCNRCLVYLSSVNRYLTHTKQFHHCYICHECFHPFTTKKSLLRHRPIHTGLRRYACTLCLKGFYRRDHCKNHTRLHTEIVSDTDNSCVISVAKPFIIKTNENNAVVYNIEFKHTNPEISCTNLGDVSPKSAKFIKFTEFPNKSQFTKIVRDTNCIHVDYSNALHLNKSTDSIQEILQNTSSPCLQFNFNKKDKCDSLPSIKVTDIMGSLNQQNSVLKNLLN